MVGDAWSRALRAAGEWRRSAKAPRQQSLPVVIGSGSPPFPFRTRKLSLIPPMVLHGKLCGRVGRCRHYSSRKPARFASRAFALYAGAARERPQFPMRMGSLPGPPRTLGGGVEEQVAAGI